LPSYLSIALVGAVLFFKNAPTVALPASQAAGAASDQPIAPHLAHTTTPVPVLELKAPRTPPKGYKEYRNDFYHCQIFYPDDMVVKLIKEKESAATITFKNAEYSEAFQIFIRPYGDPKISEDRFKGDLTSSVITDKTHITVDGADASAFYSKDDSLGDMREVWFIGRGFLYEVTTYKELSDWLSQRMNTWKFL